MTKEELKKKFMEYWTIEDYGLEEDCVVIAKAYADEREKELIKALNDIMDWTDDPDIAECIDVVLSKHNLNK